MPSYSEEFKQKVVQKMMPPNASSVAQVQRDTGISVQTLYTWRNKYRQEGKVVPADSSNPDNWSGSDKLAVIIETAALNEHELSTYCRKKGLYPEQIERWKGAAIAGNEGAGQLDKSERRNWQEEKKQRKNLEKELRRKDKALAETAALIVLQKKPRPFGGSKRNDYFL
ncbi:MAG: transposase [Methylococcales bacterium]|nr:transposase [Methylococcales bacterium]MBT7445410.1 transposase [Methylococcales bacterium]